MVKISDFFIRIYLELFFMLVYSLLERYFIEINSPPPTPAPSYKIAHKF